MMIKILIPIYLIALWACPTIHEEICIRNIDSKQNVFGFSNAEYIIGEDLDIRNIDTSGIHLEVREGKLNSVSIHKNKLYELSNGVRIGMHKQAIIGKMGTPLKENITASKGTVEINIMDALIYDGFLITLNSKGYADWIIMSRDYLTKK